MKYIILIVSSLVLLSCRSSYELSTTSFYGVGKFTGEVSHKYRKQGCKTIIVIIGNKEDVTQVIIPVFGLEKKFDKNNLKITFDYLPLKVKQPEGCTEGIPAEISNVKISKL